MNKLKVALGTVSAILWVIIAIAIFVSREPLSWWLCGIMALSLSLDGISFAMKS